MLLYMKLLAILCYSNNRNNYDDSHYVHNYAINNVMRLKFQFNASLDLILCD